MKIADLTTQHYVNNGVPDFHQRMQEDDQQESNDRQHRGTPDVQLPGMRPARCAVGRSRSAS